MDMWTNKAWYVDTMEYYSVLKGNYILIHAKTSMNLENICAGKMSQKQKTDTV